ncbi:NYN domain-containing protein [Photobacterium damselae]|uniref:NYN domain-containing protein n=1 Tax=Photobacterium damselae TaxID=38293 RepID=UPI00351A15F7
MSPLLNFAVLVDGENAQARKYIDILSEVSTKGSIAIKWIYADWTNQPNKGWEGVIRETARVQSNNFTY